MLNADLTRTVLELPAEDRLELARWLVGSVDWPSTLNAVVAAFRRRNLRAFPFFMLYGI